MRSYLAAAIQMRASSSKEKNLITVEKFIRLAVERGVSLVVLPEMFLWRGWLKQEPEKVELIPGPTTNCLQNLATKFKIYLLAGSFFEKSDEARAYNTSLLISPQGKLMAQYRKIHLFDVDIPDQISMKESNNVKPGEEVIVASTSLGIIGLSVCYDLRFPELYRKLTNKGAEIISVPSAFAFATGEAHWEALLRARAIENQVYIIAPNQIGKNVYGFSDYGNSMIVDPWGKVMARAPDRECFIIAEINLDYLEKVRKELPCLTHQRL